MDRYHKEALGETIRLIVATACGIFIGFLIWGWS